MDVQPGGEWNLTMHGPDGTDYKNKSIFKEVVPFKKLVYEHVSAPKFLATIDFEAQGEKTLLNWHMLFETKEQFIQVVKTFKADEGLRQNVEKLQHYLQTRLNLYKQLNTNKTSRVSTYLNFPGNTEEAFNFYKSIFGGEFGGGGLQRFGDLPPTEGQPPMSDEQKKLIIHAELEILGGHYIMATDAPESMGFTLNKGNNMHINLDIATRAETKRLFDALAKDGEITMELRDMFLGSYFAHFGSCTDKYGINWMFNCNEQVN
jgi:PhnB protein